MRGDGLLVLGAGPYSTGVLRELRGAGYRTFVVDRDPAAPGFTSADAHAVADLSDPEQVLAAARHWRVAGVMPLNDPGVRTAAHVAAALGLVGVSPRTAEASNDKGLMRERWREHGLPIPDFRVVTDVAGARAAAAEIGYPLVVKPADSGGGARGVSTAHGPEDVDWSFSFALPFARNGRIVVETFMDGLELTIETLTVDGATHVLAMSDKVKPQLRTRVATSLNYPAALPDMVREQVETLVCLAVSALEIHQGPAHTEVILTADGPMLVETGARGGGGHIFSTIIEAVSGINAVQQTARILLGSAPDLPPPLRRGCVYRFFNPVPGVLREVRGVEAARLLPGVLEMGIIKRPGDRVGQLVNSLERAGFAVVTGRDRAEAIARADLVEQTIAFDVIPA